MASCLRQNILRELSKVREIRIMKLCGNLRSTYIELNRNLLLLQREGILTNIYKDDVAGQGRIRIIRLNKDNPKTQVLLEVLKKLDQEGSNNQR
jgi:hypothetical protein